MISTLCLRLPRWERVRSGGSAIRCPSNPLGWLTAIGQKRHYAPGFYTSVSHFGFMVLGIFIGSQIAPTGAMVYMVAHGVSIAMFLLSGWLSRRGGTRHAPIRRYVA